MLDAPMGGEVEDRRLVELADVEIERGDDHLVVREAAAAMDDVPYLTCNDVPPRIEALVGLKLGGGWRAAERLAERRHRLLLAEYAYQDRFRRPHPVVPNTVRVPAEVPAPGTDRIVYLGTVTMARGTAVMVDAARRVHAATDGGCRLDVVGGARDPESARLLDDACEEGIVTWRGFVPSATALALLPGALAGLSLLQDLPNYRHSRPTKIVEYMAHGVPVVTTPLPVAVDLVEQAPAGIVVPFDDPDATAAAILALREDPARAAAYGAAGHAAALAAYDWNTAGPQFTATLRGFLA